MMNVYKNYNQEQLDSQYNTRLQVPDFAAYFERWEMQSRQAEKKYINYKNIAYGEHPLENLDIFPAGSPLSKTLVFIHGGYWHLLDKSLFHFLVSGFVQQNITTVVINYPLAPASPIDEIVNSCRKAIQWISGNVTGFNGDPSQLHILGHSAGGHLAAMLLVSEEFRFVKTVISLSGLFRLEPIMLSYVNDTIGMNRDMAIRNSPVLMKPFGNCPLLLVVGSDESNEFKTQTKELFDAWNSRSTNIKFVEVPGKNHYSILDAVAEKNAVLHNEVVQLICGATQAHK